MTDDIIEAAARALHTESYMFTDDEEDNRVVRAIIAAVTPLIRAATLEEAAQRIEADEEDYLVRNEVAAMLRSLKEQP